MILTSILLFGKVRQPLIIWLTVPLAIMGITAGLLGSTTPSTSCHCSAPCPWWAC